MSKAFGIDMKQVERERKRKARAAKVRARRARVQAIRHPVKTAFRNLGF